MKSKFKDYLLYTLSTIGVVALFISATTLPQQTSTVPESHVWEFHLSPPSGGGNGSGKIAGQAFSINKKTGEVRQYQTDYSYRVTVPK